MIILIYYINVGRRDSCRGSSLTKVVGWWCGWQVVDTSGDTVGGVVMVTIVACHRHFSVINGDGVVEVVVTLSMQVVGWWVVVMVAVTHLCRWWWGKVEVVVVTSMMEVVAMSMQVVGWLLSSSGVLGCWWWPLLTVVVVALTQVVG